MGLEGMGIIRHGVYLYLGYDLLALVYTDGQLDMNVIGYENGTFQGCISLQLLP